MQQKQVDSKAMQVAGSSRTGEPIFELRGRIGISVRLAFRTVVFTTIIALIGGLVSGCSTPYQPHGFTGGYSEIQLAKDKFMVQFAGNGYTGQSTVEVYLLFRCAEITVANGYDYFIVEESNISTKSGAIVFPGGYNSQTNIQGYSSGNYIQGTATTTGTYSPPTSIPYTKYGKTATIKMCIGDPPSDLKNAFGAHYIVKNIAKAK